MTAAAPVYLVCTPRGGGDTLPVMFDERSQSVRLRGKPAKRVDISRHTVEFETESREGKPAQVRIDRTNGRMDVRQIGGNARLEYRCERE